MTMTPGWLTGEEFTSLWIQVSEQSGTDLAESNLPVRMMTPSGEAFAVTDVSVDEDGIWITGDSK